MNTAAYGDVNRGADRPEVGALARCSGRLPVQEHGQRCLSGCGQWPREACPMRRRFQGCSWRGGRADDCWSGTARRDAILGGGSGKLGSGGGVLNPNGNGPVVSFCRRTAIDNGNLTSLDISLCGDGFILPQYCGARWITSVSIRRIPFFPERPFSMERICHSVAAWLGGCVAAPQCQGWLPSCGWNPSSVDPYIVLLGHSNFSEDHTATSGGEGCGG